MKSRGIGPVSNKALHRLSRAMILTLLLFSMNGCNTIQKNEAIGFSGGLGTELNPYEISTVEDLRLLAKETNEGHLDTYSFYTMTNDIDLKNNDFTPIGFYFSDEIDNNYKSFTGSFDGAGHIIKNLYISNSLTSLGKGIFGYIKSTNNQQPIIKNLNIENANVLCDTKDNLGAVGILVGYNGGEWHPGTNSGQMLGVTIENCHVEGKVEGNGYGVKIGGMVGINQGIIENSSATCYVVGTNSDEGSIYTGGLVGTNYGSIVESFSNSEIFGKGIGGNSLGGFVGSNFSIINDCYSAGTINAKSGNINGSIVIGGFSGTNSGAIHLCHTDTDLFGESDNGLIIGGFVGSNNKIYNSKPDYNGKIYNCYTIGTLIGIGKSLYLGGFAGDNFGAIENSYASYKIDYKGEVDDSQIGCFVGSGGLNETNNMASTHFMINCYYDANLNPNLTAIYVGDDTGVLGMSNVEITSDKFIQLLNKNDGEKKDIWTQSEISKLPIFFIK